MTDQTEGLEPTETVAERIELTSVMLGFRPYLLLEAKADPEDPEGLLLDVRAGAGAGEEIGALALLFLTSLPFRDNPLSQVLADMIADIKEDAKGSLKDIGAAVSAIRMVAKQLGVPLEPGAQARQVEVEGE